MSLAIYKADGSLRFNNTMQMIRVFAQFDQVIPAGNARYTLTVSALLPPGAQWNLVSVYKDGGSPALYGTAGAMKLNDTQIIMFMRASSITVTFRLVGYY